MTRSDISHVMTAFSAGVRFVDAIGTPDQIKAGKATVQYAAETFFENNKEVFSRENFDRGKWLCGCGLSSC